MWLWTAHTAAMLPPRLVLVHDMVPSCSVVADVGCDHGLLGTALLLSGKAQRIIAADVNKLAMERATHSVNNYAPQHASKLEVRLGDGLQPLHCEDDIDVITIAGIGLPRMHGILFEGSHTPAKLQARTLVLQPLQFRVDRLAALHQRLWADGFAVEEQRFLAPEGFKGPAVLTLRAELRVTALPKTPLMAPPEADASAEVHDAYARCLREHADAHAEHARHLRSQDAQLISPLDVHADDRDAYSHYLQGQKEMLSGEITGLRRAEHWTPESRGGVKKREDCIAMIDAHLASKSSRK